MPLKVQRLMPRVSWVEEDNTKELWLVVAIDVAGNRFSARRRKDGKIVSGLNPEAWSISGPPGTVARGSLDGEGPQGSMNILP